MKVKEMNTSIRKTAKEFGVQAQTLRDMLTGKIDCETSRSDPSPLFSQEEEDKLAKHIKFMLSVGYGYGRAEVVDVATCHAVDLVYRSVRTPLVYSGTPNFMSRWPDLKVLKPKGLQIQRAKAVSHASVSNYFQDLQLILSKYNLFQKPEKIYNVDEKGLSTIHKPPKVVAAVGTKPLSVTSLAQGTMLLFLGVEMPWVIRYHPIPSSQVSACVLSFLMVRQLVQMVQ